MRDRGSGMVYQPSWKDPKTGERKTSPTWWIQYHHRGLKKRESSHSANRNDAIKLLNRRLGDLSRGRAAGADAGKVTFGDLIRMLEDDYKANSIKSLERATDAIAHLKEAYGSDRAVDIMGDRITGYIATRRETGNAKPATIHYELAILKRMFSLAVKAGRLEQRPYIPSIEVRNVRSGFFEEREFWAILMRLPEEVRAPAEFAFLTGWRKQEILRLRWHQVDFHAGIIRLEPGTTKNDEGRTFPFSALPALKELLERQRVATDNAQAATGSIIPWVFHRDGQPIRDFRAAWKKACREAGFPGRIFHDFRRTAVRNLERAGVPRSVAMKLTGHKTESVYRRYAIVSESDLADGVAKLAALHGDRSPASPEVVNLSSRNLDKVRTK